MQRSAAPTLFVSDLHLDAERPEVTALFLAFLAAEARQARALYILGDLFEAWIGDDDPAEPGGQVADALAQLADSGVPVAFMHGNRDFLVGRRWVARARLRLLPDPCVVTLGGAPALLTHGDTLCTGDVAYQRFRAQTRDPAWQQAFLAQPLSARIAFARQARAASKAHQQALVAPGADDGPDIMDVADEAVRGVFRRFGVQRMIHGHTHRPAIHQLELDGLACQRIVLGDWYDQGSVLRVAANGAAELVALAR